MKPYDPNAKCPKCDSGDIATMFRRSETEEDAHVDRYDYSYGEFLRRDCQNCGYAWKEMTNGKAQEQRDYETKKALEEALGAARAEAAMGALQTVSPEQEEIATPA